MKKLLLLFSSLAFLGRINAQTPHKDLGIKENEIEYLTLSDGRYDEYHGYKDFERVGSAVIDMRTRKIAYFISRDSILDEGMFELDMTTRFLTIDPMAETYFEMSPYGYCANNPIKFIDPTGMLIDDYSLDGDGNIELVKKTEDKTDKLYVKNDDGTLDKDKSIEVDKGVLDKGVKLVSEENNVGDKLTQDSYNIKDDSKASALFEFVANNTNVEWNLLAYGKNEGVNGQNLLITSHEPSSVESSNLIFWLAGARNENIRRDDHNHPSGNPTPSDYQGDLDVVKRIARGYNQNPLYRIYTKQDGQYHPYNASGPIKKK